MFRRIAGRRVASPTGCKKQRPYGVQRRLITGSPRDITSKTPGSRMNRGCAGRPPVRRGQLTACELSSISAVAPQPGSRTWSITWMTPFD